MSIHKWAWGISLILIGLSLTGLVAIPYLVVAAGVALVIAGVAFIAGI